jgi:hypothetical protein
MTFSLGRSTLGGTDTLEGPSGSSSALASATHVTLSSAAVLSGLVAGSTALSGALALTFTSSATISGLHAPLVGAVFVNLGTHGTLSGVGSLRDLFPVGFIPA